MSEPTITTALLAAARVGGFVGLLPPLQGAPVPAQLRVGLTVALTGGLLYSGFVANAPENLTGTALLVAGVTELALGLGLGFAASLVFQAVMAAGRLINLQAGLDPAAIISPDGGESRSAIETIVWLTASAAFLALDGHHLWLTGLARSLDIVPVGSFAVSQILPGAILELAGQFWRVVLLLSLPVVGAVLLADVALAVLSRIVPMLNVLLVATPLKVAVGLGALAVGLPGFVATFERFAPGFVDRGFAAMVGR